MKNNKQKLGLAAAVLAGSLVGALADPVEFNVNMSVQTALGNFNAGSGDSVWVLGLEAPDWSTGISMAPSANPDIYTVTTNLAAGIWPNYKFVIKPASGSWIWESPASTGGGNRYFQVPAGGTNLPAVYFSDNTNMPSYSVEITFQLNMEIAILQGQFNQGSDYLNVFGSFNNWSTTGLLLTNAQGTSNYVGVLTTAELVTNSVVYYKYAINGNGGTWEGNVGPGGTQNRIFTVTNSVQALPLDYWNNVTNLNSIPVGFEVNLTVEDALGVFTPGVDSVFVAGDWNWSGTAVQLLQVGSSDLYTGTVALAIAPGTTVDYKYNINSISVGYIWESDGVGPGGAKNRRFVLNAETNLPADYFNNYRDIGPLYIGRQGSETALTWPAGTNVNNRIRLQNSAVPSGGWSDVPNTQGQSGITNDFGAGPVYFRLIGP